MNEAAVVESSSQQRALPITVAVGHSSTLVAAGLVATLARTPGCDIRLQRISPAAWGAEYAPPAQLIFGDSALLRCLRRDSNGPALTDSVTGAKFVLVTTDDEIDAHAFKATGEIDECLSIECREEELFATVQRLIDFGRRWSDTPERIGPTSAARGGLAPGALRRVRDHIEQHLASKLQTEDLAAIAGLSPGHFNRAFKQSTGKAPHQYVTLRRVAKATQLLEKTTRALADIALEVGFSDQSHFSRTYVAVAGETPSARRRKHR